MYLSQVFAAKFLKKAICWLAGAFCFLLLPHGTLHAQQTSGSIVGTVTDNAGAVVPNATVTLVNVDTGDTRTATTSGSGEYQFINLVPGNYNVSMLWYRCRVPPASTLRSRSVT
jgi:protocatechuate 3,4-dioxygenase beta subunit